MAFQYGMLMQLSIMLLVVLVLAATRGGAEDEIAIARPNCTDKCGDLRIPYPFGIGDGCYFRPQFNITCNQSKNEPRLMKTRIIVTNISLEDGELEILQLVNRDCYEAGGYPKKKEDQSKGGLWVYPPYTISGDKNRMFVVGCDTYAHLVGSRGDQSYTTGCNSICDKNPGGYAYSVYNNDTCSGMGCCRTKIPPLLNNLTLTVRSYNNHTKVNRFNPCGFAFVVKKDNFTFSNTSFQQLQRTDRLPLVLDWQIREESCEIAMQNNQTFACKGNNSICHDKPSSGYICRCKEGYKGNPYLEDSCRDIDECKNSTLCKNGKCKNKEGNYTCVCDSGYKNLNDITCIKVPSAKPLKISLGVSLSFCVLLVATFWKYRERRIRQLEKLKKQHFQANGGGLLQEQMARLGETARSFTEAEVKDKDATNNYAESKKVGEGSYGIVYKGILKVGGGKQMVAIKKSKVSFPIHQNQSTSPVDDQKRIVAREQFVNEMTALYQINHKNVVRLIGCCLDIPKPILVYEFMRKGTLYENIHGTDGEKQSPLPLEHRLKIAAETAEALAYLHHDIPKPIKHGDVKTSNILLDEKLTAKLSGFGASKLVREEDENQTPESNTITEKSDVYSFGLVLAELLTGIKREANLENVFLALVEGGTLGQTLDTKIVKGHSNEAKKAGDLATECLKSKEKEGPWPSMKAVASKLQGLVQSMEQHPSGGGEPNRPPSPNDSANLGGPSTSSAFLMDIRGEGGDGDGGGSSVIITSADSSIMEITPHGDGR